MTEPGENWKVFTVEEFYSSVRELEPRVAVFDYDGTMWPGDAGLGFMEWTIETGLLPPTPAARLLERHAAYRRGEVEEIPICGEMVQIYAGIPEEALRQSAHTYFQRHVRARVFPEMEALLLTLKGEGVDVWVVSSTNTWMIEEAVAELGVGPERVLAACVAVRDGVATETLVDVPSDEGKAAALRRVGVAHPDAVFGNSVHDAAMLAMARRAFAVNPSPALEQLSAERGWAVYYPAAQVPDSANEMSTTSPGTSKLE